MEFVIALAIFLGQTPPDVKVMLGNVSEMRSQGCCPSLTVDLKLTGTDVRKVMGVLPARIESVQTDGDQDLRPEAKDDQFLMLNAFKTMAGAGSVPVRLNPARRDAKQITLKGELPLFVPSAEYKPQLVAPDFIAGSGKPVEHEALKSREISLVAFTTADHDKYVEERKNAANAAGPLDALSEAFGDALSELLSFGTGGGGDIVVLVNDPKDQLLTIRFIAPDGSEVRPSGRSSMHQFHQGKVTYDFSGKSLDGVDLAVDLVDDKQVISIPFEISTDLP